MTGDLILRDLGAMTDGRDPRELSAANPARIGSLAGVGDAAQAGRMAEKRS